jgi:hypothetical protein
MYVSPTEKRVRPTPAGWHIPGIRSCLQRGGFVVVCALAAAPLLAVGAAAEIEPLIPLAGGSPLGEAISRYSARTVSVGLQVDRDGISLVAYTVKNRPFDAPASQPQPRAFVEGRPVQLEVELSSTNGTIGERYTRRLSVGPLCLTHGPDAEPHVLGDTILRHRDSFVVELPELPNLDRIAVAFFEKNRGQTSRRTLGSETLDRLRFTPAGRPVRYEQLAFADGATPAAAGSVESATPIWPEDFDDPDIYRVWGDGAEVNRRINIVIVPDGYTYADKALMETHAQAMVTHFRGKTPFAEHDPFFNYILVYAYSVDSGTDQCDCGIVLDTAMGTRFPDAGDPCGGSGNRCLYYGGGCDTNGSINIVTAELRAPAQDETIVMVNTSRYGGCGGARAVYSAANSAATEVAVHELGHSLAGLADEYSYNDGCGTGASEINTSLDSSAAWPEWSQELGPGREGAQYYTQCIYRPLDNCEMRSLNQPFCPVCNQRWSLVVFGHQRVSSTAPVVAAAPGSPVTAYRDVPMEFSVEPRLSVGPGVTNSFTWSLQGPGDLEPYVVATGTPAHTQLFDEPGTHTLTCEVVADTNFVKPEKYGSNRDVASWDVDVQALAPPPEVSPPGAAQALLFPGSAILTWEDLDQDALTYNVYRGIPTDLSAGEFGECFASGLATNSAPVDPIPDPGVCWTFLVSGTNPAGEGPLGQGSHGTPRPNLSPCP